MRLSPKEGVFGVRVRMVKTIAMERRRGTFFRPEQEKVPPPKVSKLAGFSGR
jgi:hypothetical protein